MGRKVGLYVNRNTPRLQDIICSRKEHGWSDNTPVVCPNELTCFLPHSSCKVVIRKTDTQVFAAYLCQDKPVEYPLCILTEETASKFDCLEKLEEFGIVF